MHTESTAAFVGAARLHADSLARLPATAQAGLWIVQDTKGRLISSGILSPFPTTFSSDHIADVVPGAAGLSPIEFGFALTPAERNRPAVRAAFVTVRPHS
jgi:hypothetical protein